MDTKALAATVSPDSAKTKVKVKVKLLSRVRLFATLWIVAYQAPQSMEFSRQEHWSGLPFYETVKFLFINVLIGIDTIPIHTQIYMEVSI